MERHDIYEHHKQTQTALGDSKAVPTAALCEIYDAHIESLVPTPRPTFVRDRQYPSRDLLTFVEMRFSGDHVDDGWHSPEILRLQHYEFLIDAVVKKLPKLLAWFESIVAKRYTRTALSSKAGPMGILVRKD